MNLQALRIKGFFEIQFIQKIIFVYGLTRLRPEVWSQSCSIHWLFYNSKWCTVYPLSLSAGISHNDEGFWNVAVFISQSCWCNDCSIHTTSELPYMVVMSHMMLLSCIQFLQLMKTLLLVSMCVCVSVVTTIAALLLPIETKGQAMRVRCSVMSRALILFSVETACRGSSRKKRPEWFFQLYPLGRSQDHTVA